MEQRALQVGERDVGVDGEPLDLVELGSVRSVAVGPVDAARNHDVQRWRMRFHRADLPRRSMGAQHELLGSAEHSGPSRARIGNLPSTFALTRARRLDVEGVGSCARGMRGTVVERVEVVVDGLDLRALEDGEAETDEDVLQFAPGRSEHVQATDGLRRRPGQRDVEAFLAQAPLQLLRAELRRAALDQRLELLTHEVGGLADDPAFLTG